MSSAVLFALTSILKSNQSLTIEVDPIGSTGLQPYCNPAEGLSARYQCPNCDAGAHAYSAFLKWCGEGKPSFPV